VGVLGVFFALVFFILPLQQKAAKSSKKQQKEKKKANKDRQDGILTVLLQAF